MTYYVQTLLLVFIEALCCKIFFATFWEKRYLAKKWINIVLFMVLWLGFAGIAFLPGQMYVIKAITSILLISMVSCIQYRSKWLQTISWGIIYYGLLICIDRGILIVLEKLPKIDKESVFNDPVKAVIIALLCKMILLILIIVIHKKVKLNDGFNLVTDREWLRFLFFPVTTVICMTAFVAEGGIGSQSTFALVLSNFLLFYIISDVIFREKVMLKMTISQERIKNQIDMYQYMENVYEEQRKKNT